VLENRRIYLDNDTRLMTKTSEGDKKAFVKLYRTYFSVVVSFISSLDSQFQSTEDIAQEVFTRIWENRVKYQPIAAFKTYLFACAKNVLKENKSSADKEITLDIDKLSHLTAKSYPFKATAQNEEVISSLEKLCVNLPDRQRQSFELIYITGLSPAKTAEILNCSLNAVHCAVYRARKILRRLLQFPRETVNCCCKSNFFLS